MGSQLSCNCFSSEPLLSHKDISKSKFNFNQIPQKTPTKPAIFSSTPVPLNNKPPINPNVHIKQTNRPSHETKKVMESATILVAPPNKKKLSIQDFLIVRCIGKGAFGKVLLVKKNTNPAKTYAMKIMKKMDIYQNKLVDNIVLEKTILQKNKNPFVVNLKYAFQTSSKVYLVMEYLVGGELFNLLRKHNRFPEEAARFYFAEVLLAIGYLHKEMNIIYRDLKPENILLTEKGHLKITDFGLSKQTEGKAYTFAGTPEYLAPEILINKGHTKAVDFWSLGILLFEMLAGVPPFTTKDRAFAKIEKLILENKPQFPDFFSSEAISLLKGLLEPVPEKRLGTKSINDVKNHSFFKTVNWEMMEKMQVPPPFTIHVAGTAHGDRPGFEIRESLDNQAMPNLPGITYNPDQNLMNSQKESMVVMRNFEKNKINELLKKK